MCSPFHRHIKQELATHIWINNKHNNYENICWCVQWNEPDFDHMEEEEKPQDWLLQSFLH